MESVQKAIWTNFKTAGVVQAVLVLFIMFGAVVPISGLDCYQCGQFTDGVGSITPCINFTSFHLKPCPADAKACVKYVNEGSTVRECAKECTEKRSDSWGTSVYCCAEDSCNASSCLVPSHPLLALVAIISLSIAATATSLRTLY